MDDKDGQKEGEGEGKEKQGEKFRAMGRVIKGEKEKGGRKRGK